LLSLRRDDIIQIRVAAINTAQSLGSDLSDLFNREIKFCGNFYIIETKDRNDLGVLQKDKYAKVWCEKASLLTKANWTYIKVMQKDFEELHPDNMEELKQIN